MPKEPSKTVDDVGGGTPRAWVERGYTLVEMIIVVGVVGIIAMIATVEVSKTLKKQRLDAQSQEIKGFIDRCFIESQRLRVPIFCQIQPINGGSWWLARVADDGGTPNSPVTNLQFDDGVDTVLERKRVPADLCFSRTSTTAFEAITPPTTGPAPWPRVNGNPTILCTVAGQSLQPNQPQAMLTQRVLEEPLTHTEMVQDVLHPKFAYMIQITPLFSCTVVREKF